MRIGIIGPAESVEIVLHEANRSNLPIECVPLVYSHFFEAIELIETARPDVDAFLFTGTTSYTYALQESKPEEPWEYLPRSVNSLVYAMLKLVYLGGYDIRKISIDSYDEAALRTAYWEIGIAESEAPILAHGFQSLSPDYYEQIIAFHRDNIKSGRADFCLTRIQTVYEVLKASNIPVAKPFATSEMILQQLQRLYINYYTNKNEKDHRYGVISVSFKFSKDKSLYSKSDLQLYLYRANAVTEIYSFAQRIRAAVEEHDTDCYHLYSMENVIHEETKNCTDLVLLHNLQKLEGVTLAVAGIGFGDNPEDAKHRADIGKERALAGKISSFFIVGGDRDIVGPMVSSSPKYQNGFIDRKLNLISQRTGIGVTRLFQIEQVTKRNGLETTTPGELARLCNMTLGNMNRILAKLEGKGYARVIGKQPSPSHGRPSRLIQLLF